MIGGLIKLVAGGALKSVLSALGDADKRRIDAKNNTDRIEADKEISGLEARRDVLVSEARYKVNMFFRAFMAVGPAVYVFKIFFIDKVVCPVTKLDIVAPHICRTDPITDPFLLGVMAAVIGFYFMTNAKKT